MLVHAVPLVLGDLVKYALDSCDLTGQLTSKDDPGKEANKASHRRSPALVSLTFHGYLLLTR
jgi:hypothetical protein